MKTGIHPELIRTTITCSSCGTTRETTTTRAFATVDVCSSCHPAYTGVQRQRTHGGRVERFERRRRLATARS
jgi:large subunit ribosomal protein L31